MAHAKSPDWKEWLAAIHRALDAAARYRTNPPQYPANAIHLCRSRLKEARALLHLAPPSLRGVAKTCRNELARTARTLSSARDNTVIAATVRALIRQNRDLKLSIFPSELRHGQLVSRDHERALLQEASACSHRAGKLLATWPIPPETPDYLAVRAAKALRRARKSVPVRFRNATPDAMHELRKSIIICRYQSAFMSRYHGTLTPALTARLEKLRKKLGRLNDLYRLEMQLTHCSLDRQSDTFKTLDHAFRRTEKRLKKASRHLARKALSPARMRDMRH